MAKKIKKTGIKWKQIILSYVLAYILICALTILPNIKSFSGINVIVQAVTNIILFASIGF